MRIGIDACCWSNRRGFGRFTRELVTHLLVEGPEHEFVLFVDRHTSNECALPSGATSVVVDTREQPTTAARADGARSVGDLWRMGRAVAKDRLDLFFFPAVYSYFPLHRRLPTIVTLHDAIAESLPQLIFPSRRARLFWNLKMRLALRQADRVLTVSEDARQQITQRFGRAIRRIDVISEGPGSEFQRREDSARTRAVPQRYGLPVDVPLILYVGGISPHKNLDGLLHAAAILSRQATSWHLALVGDYQADSFFGCHAELKGLCSDLGLFDRVTFTGFVPNDDLVELYNAATAFILPSLCEGFGLPVVEAMACGAPVAASRRGSLPEIVGDAGLLFDPENHAEMAAVLLKLLTDGELRARLRRDGLARAEQYSWGTAARSALRVFEETAHAGS